MSTKPVLRPLDFQPVIYQGEPMWWLRDPLQLTDFQLILPPALAQMLVFIDGTREAHEIHQAFCTQLGERLDDEIVVTMLAQLDEACLLDNARARQAQRAQLEEYRAQPFRPAALAGRGYPADPDELSRFFAAFGAGSRSHVTPAWKGRAVVSPHIDYERGGTVYGRVWQHASVAVAEADLVLIFGTDHSGGLGTITLTEQAYATPFGVLPADRELVTALADAIGPEKAFALELNHREEHSVELSAVWLHHTYRQLGQAPAPMVPILCGSFQHFVENGHHPLDDERLNIFVDVLHRRTAGRRVLAVASVDLAHVGPVFGDPHPMNEAQRAVLRASDKDLIAAINRGDHSAFYGQIAAIGDNNRICGFSSIYLLLRYLEKRGPVRGVEIAYRQCPADEEEASLVSICGLLLE